MLRTERLRADDVLSEARRRCAEYHPGRELELEPSDGPLPDIRADGVLVQRVLGNLLDNAAKYSDPGSSLRLGAEATVDAVAFEVRDGGIGVDEDDLPHLFDHFFRTDRSRARGSGGVGLGLTLCKRIVEAHGGTIGARNHPDGGLVVRFTLPRAMVHSS